MKLAGSDRLIIPEAIRTAENEMLDVGSNKRCRNESTAGEIWRNAMRFDNIDLASLAMRLIAARKAAGITQEDAAKHLEISRPTFILIEKGSRRPKPSEIVKLSSLYKEPLNKLLRSDQEAPALQPHLRSAMESLSEGVPEVSHATLILASYVDDYSQLERLVEAHSVSNFPPPVSN